MYGDRRRYISAGKTNPTTPARSRYGADLEESRYEADLGELKSHTTTPARSRYGADLEESDYDDAGVHDSWYADDDDTIYRPRDDGHSKARKGPTNRDLLKQKGTYSKFKEVFGSDEDDYDLDNDSRYVDPNASNRQPLNPGREENRDQESVGSDEEYFDDEDENMERLPLGHPGNHRGILVTFYRYRDPHFKGLKTSVSRKLFPTFETLLVWLNEKIPTTAGVRHIFALENGREITDVGDLIGGKSYVISSTREIKNFKGIMYGDSKERFWSNQAASASRIRRSERDLFLPRADKKSHSWAGSRASSHNSYSYGTKHMGAKPKVLNVVNNNDRNIAQKVLFNPLTTQSFQGMLMDIGDLVEIEDVKKLYTFKSPYREIQSFSHLMNVLKTTDTFLACGSELFPLELQAPGMVNGAPVNGNGPEKKKPKRVGRPIQNDALPPDSKKRLPPASSGSISLAPYLPDTGDRHSIVTESDMDRGQLSPEGDMQLDILPNKSLQPVRQSQEFKPDNRPIKPANSRKDKPYRKDPPPVNSIKVHIHGNLREFFVPRFTPSDQDGSRPDKNNELNWVYGYRGMDGRNNMYTLPSGEIVYHVAAVGVVYNRQLDRQRHYQEHTEDITCMAMCPNGSHPLIATGQLGGKNPAHGAHVRVWDPFTMTTKSIIGTNFFSTAVSAVGFSGISGEERDGYYMLAIDDSNKHTLSVWDWNKGILIAKTSTSGDSVVWGTFHPHDHSIIITYGKQHIYFWKMFFNPKKDSTGRILRDKKSGLLPMDDVPRYVTSVAFAPSGDVLTGDSNGCITIWRRDSTDAFVNKFSEATKHAHNKSIFALFMMNDGTLLSGAGCEIKAWDSTNNYRLVKERKAVPEGCGTIRTLVPQHIGSTDGSLYIGLTSNGIMEGSLQDKFKHIVHGHSEQLYALASHPDEQVFITAGYDQYVIKWNMRNHWPEWRTYIEKPGLSVDVDPFGRLVVVGTTMGRFIVLEAYSGVHMASVQVTSEAIDAIKFSPDGNFLAMGSHDHNIYVYDVLDEGQAYRKHRGSILKGHTNSVHNLDWSRDGRYIQTVSMDYDLLFWDVQTMKSVSAPLMREVEWHTQTCVINYNLLGAWSNLKDEEDITTVCRNNQNDSLAVGDNEGNIRLYRFPCTAERPECYIHKRYSGKINKLAYSYNDCFMVSSGGTDAGLLQWATIEESDYL